MVYWGVMCSNTLRQGPSCSPAQQALASEVHGYQGRAAGGVHRHAGAVKIKTIGNAVGQNGHHGAGSRMRCQALKT